MKAGRRHIYLIRRNDFTGTYAIYAFGHLTELRKTPTKTQREWMAKRTPVREHGNTIWRGEETNA